MAFSENIMYCPFLERPETVHINKIYDPNDLKENEVVKGLEKGYVLDPKLPVGYCQTTRSLCVQTSNTCPIIKQANVSPDVILTYY